MFEKHENEIDKEECVIKGVTFFTSDWKTEV